MFKATARIMTGTVVQLDAAVPFGVLPATDKTAHAPYLVGLEAGTYGFAQVPGDLSHAEVGQAVRLAENGPHHAAYAVAGGAITTGQWLTFNASSQAIANPAANDWVFGRALEPGAAGTLFRVTTCQPFRW